MPLDEAWLKPLECPVDDEALRARTLELAEREGVRLFREEEAEAAAEHLKAQGFVVLLDALRGDALRALQRTSAGLIRQAEKSRPEGNRGAQRWSLGRTTAHNQWGKACLEPADNESVCAVLRHFWRSEKFTLLCTGGDFSLPGAAVQGMHADIGERSLAAGYFSFDELLRTPTSATVKVYLTLAAFDDATGPPVFVPGSHMRFTSEDVPTEDPEGSKHAFCPCGSAIIMDLRVWHHGSPNRSQVARPMLSLHYAAPWYSENVLTRPNMYWAYHRGALSREAILAMRPRARQLCSHLVHQQCAQCDCPAGSAEPASGWHRGWWYCESCWAE